MDFQDFGFFSGPSHEHGPGKESNVKEVFKCHKHPIPQNRQIFIAHPERCQTMAEILRSVASESCPGDQRGASCPGEIREENDLEKQAPARGSDTVSCTLWNDLQVAVEVKLGEGSNWQIVYPEAQLKLAMVSTNVRPQLSVRLRDDLDVSGVCTAVQGSTFQLSSSFGDFGERAMKHFQEEETVAEEESRLRKQRQKELDQKLGAEVTQAILWRQKWVMISLFLFLLMVLTAMISCTVATNNLLTELQGLGLALGLWGLFPCASCGFAGLLAASGDGAFAKDLRSLVQATRPELQGYEDQGVQAKEGDWRCLLSFSCFFCVPLVSLGSVFIMTVVFHLNGNSYLAGVLWGPLAMLMCCGGVIACRAGKNFFLWALFFPFFWPSFLDEWSLESRLVKVFLKPPKRSLDAAVHTTHEHTIVFEGNVLPKRETVCSWPGKYATAWDELVAGSRQNDISAAVVFLPKGSEHFGFHDPIPAKHDLRDLHGECWCTPLYGEQKPWGCRWWSKWIDNVELAVSQDCTLVVYYFNGMKGNGRVKDFTTAGEEHMRREAIFRCKDAFLKSDTFQNALEAGLKQLSKEQGPDSSSPYSREVHRLFLATLLEEDRRFLEASEGLGNSQKAEVAWLERNGYQYMEKEIWELASSSPKAIGRATE